MSLNSILVPNAGCLLGVYPGGSCDAATSDLDRLRNHEAKINRTTPTNGLVNIVHSYRDFSDYVTGFPKANEQTMAAEGRLLLIGWSPRLFGTTTHFKWADIAAGTYDGQYVDPTARAMRDWGRRFFLVFHTEMNQGSVIQGGDWGTDAEYASAARHVHDRFVAQGATNVVWVWCPSGYVDTISRMNTLYPGDQFVDWIAYDPYGSGGQGADYVIDTKYPMLAWANGTNPTYSKTTIPSGITVTPQGTTGATTYSYKLTSVNAAGETVASAAVQITNGNAVLSGVNFNRIAWAVSSGATSTKIYGRTAGSWLLIATVNAPTSTFDDTGAVTPTGAPPTLGAIGDLGKPLMWAEWADKEAAGPTTKAAFIDQVRTLLPATYPPIKAIAWFNSTSGVSECFDTSSATLNAYKTLAADPYFRPDMSDAPAPVGQGSFRASSSAAFNNTASKDIVIPPTVQAGDGMLLFHTCTRAELRNAAEGTNGIAVSVGNSSAAGSNPADAIAGTAPTYDTTSPLDGTSSMHAAVTAATTSGFRWSTSFNWPGSGGSYKGRLLYRYPSNPSAICRIYQQASATGANQWGIGIDTNGKIIVRDLAAGATRGTSTATPATATRHRIEWEATWNGATTTVTVKLFLGTNWNGTTPDETFTSTAFTQAAAPGQGTWGVHFSAANTYDLHLDQWALDLAAWPGPVGSHAALTLPAGWVEVVPTGTQQVAAGAGELSSRCFRRTAAAGDPGSTITLATDVNAHGSIALVAYSGTEQLAVVDVAAAAIKSADSATVTSPNATTLVAGDLIISAFFDRANPAAGGATSAWTLPGGETQRAATFGTGTDGRVAGLVTDDAVTHAVGTYGSKVATADKTSYLAVGWTAALLSSAAAGPSSGVGFLHTVN